MPEDKVVAQNRKARHEYFILESFETGIVLYGTEIKSVREGQVNLKDGFARVENENCGCTTFTYRHTIRGATTIKTR